MDKAATHKKQHGDPGTINKGLLLDKDLEEIADSLLRDWWKLLTNLSILISDIKVIECKFPNAIKKQAFEGLMLWKRKRTEEKKDEEFMLNELINAMKEIKREDLVFMISSITDNAMQMSPHRSMSSPSSILHVALSDRYLNSIASRMSTDSNNIFYNLGLTSKDIKCIEYSFPNDLDRQAFEGLIKWRDQTDMMIKDSEYMIAELNTAFIEVKRQDLVDYINNLTVSHNDLTGASCDGSYQQQKQTQAAFNVCCVEKALQNYETGDKKKQRSFQDIRDYFENFSDSASNKRDKPNIYIKNVRNVHSKVPELPDKPVNSQVNIEKGIFLERLGLQTYYPEKITLAEVVGIHKSSDNVCVTDIPFIFLRNIMMANYKARDILIEIELDKISKFESKATDWNLLDGNEDVVSNIGENILKLNPLDLVVSVWLCSSPELRQVLANKLFLCRLAIPLALPSEPNGIPVFHLWPLRSILLEQNIEDGYIHSNPLKCPCHIVSFFRLGKICISKSVLMNRLLSDKVHNSFFNKDCNLGTMERKISEGLIEVSWCLTAEKNIHMYVNLRGNTFCLTKEFNAVSQISSIVILLMNIESFKDPEARRRIDKLHQNGLCVIVALDAMSETESNAKQICQLFLKKLDKFKDKTKICKIASNGIIRGFADIKKDIMNAINMALQNEEPISMSRKISSRKDFIFKTDEEREDFTSEKVKASAVMKLIPHDSVNVKHCVVPLQGQLWKDFSKHLKIEQRYFNISSTTFQKEEIYKEKEEKCLKQINKSVEVKNEMSKHRQEQVKKYEAGGILLKLFINNFCACKSDKDRILFTNYLTLALDNRSRTLLPEFMSRYQIAWKELKRVRDRREIHLQEFQTKYEEAEVNLAEASFGFEHLLRECGQLYEALRSKEDLDVDDVKMCDKLSQMAVDLLLMGHPIEVLDGDAANIPMEWLKEVMKKLKEQVGDKKILNLSVIGIQSSGKSTLLNTMFGLKYAVSAGRCTRGVYMQLVPVKNENFNYIAVIDTEGLRAMELSHQKHDHDNKLATFIIGLADATIINIKGENTTEMRDILQIAVHAFLRLKLVNNKLNLKQSCVFVHQNVPASDANVKMKPGRQKLVEILDEMTREAAQQENMTNIQSFNQVIEFDCDENVWYCSDLWEGNPPMAPTNPGYSEIASNIKNAVIAKLAFSRDTFLTITDTMIRIEDLWVGILRDDFVYGFRNSLEMKAYSTMEKRYQEIVCNMSTFFNEFIIKKAKTVIGGCTAKEDLDSKVREVKNELRVNAEDLLTKSTRSYEEFMKDNDLKDVMVQWMSSRKVRLKMTKESLLTETESEIADLKKDNDISITHTREKRKYESEMNEIARQVAQEIQGKKADDQTIMDRFNEKWNNFLQNFSSISKDIEDATSVKDRIEKSVLSKREKTKGLFKKAKEDFNYESMTGLVGSMNADQIKIAEHIEVTTEFIQKINPCFISEVQKKVKERAVDVSNTIFQRIDNEINRIASEDRRFKDKCVEDIIKIIDDIIDDHNANQSKRLNFNLLNPYSALVTAHVVKYITCVLTRNEEDYNRRHSLRCQLENYKETALELFRGIVDKETEDMIAANFVQKVLIEKATEQILDLIPLDVFNCMMKWYNHQKICVIKEVMKNLAEKKDFNNCYQYIMDPSSFVEKWLTEKMSKIFDKTETEVSEYENFANKNIMIIVAKTKKITQETTQNCIEQSKLSIDEWIKLFCTALSSSNVLPVSEDMFSRVLDREKAEISTFEVTVLNKICQMEDIIREKFRKTTFHNVKWRKNPITEIMNALWGCKQKCPFCFEPCKITSSDHEEDNIKHQCLQHRIRGLRGKFWSKAGTLTINFCNIDILDYKFSFEVKKNDCKRIIKYRNYQKQYATWYIEPTMDTSKYWIWLLCYFKKNFERKYGRTFDNIPNTWENITLEEALKSLE